MPGSPKRSKKKQEWLIKSANPDWWDEWFQRISTVGHLAICLRDEGIPNKTYYAFLDQHPDLKERNSQALKEYSHTLANKVKGNADALDQSHEYHPDPKSAKVAIDAYQWLASRYNPEQYGDKQHIDVKTTDLTQLRLEALKNLTNHNVKIIKEIKKDDEHDQ